MLQLLHREHIQTISLFLVHEPIFSQEHHFVFDNESGALPRDPGDIILLIKWEVPVFTEAKTYGGLRLCSHEGILYFSIPIYPLYSSSIFARV